MSPKKVINGTFFLLALIIVVKNLDLGVFLFFRAWTPALGQVSFPPNDDWREDHDDQGVHHYYQDAGVDAE